MLGVDRLLSRISPAAALRQALRLSERGDSVEAFKYFAQAAEGGIAEAERRVANCYFEGLGVPSSRSEGVQWLERAADHGDVEAQVLLAGMCAQGFANLSRDKAKSVATDLFSEEADNVPDFELRAALGAPRGGSRLGQGAGHSRLCADARPGTDPRSRGRA